MSKSKIHFILITILLFALAVHSFGQTIPPAGSEGKLIAVLKSDAGHKEKADACRQLALIGTKDAVAPLAALLGDEKLSHMARYGLEPIPDPAVDKALRDALGKLKGRPLIGVIGSIGVRRDTKAVDPLKKILMQHDSDPEVTHAVVRALGNIGNSIAAEVLQTALAHAPEKSQLDICEGLLRCAERLAAEGNRNLAVEIYDQLRALPAPHQVRGGAVRGAILARGRRGLPLLRQYLRSDDYILFSAAVQTAQELPYTEVTSALTAELNQLPADNQILVIQTLGKRGDRRALPALFTLAESGEKSVRLAAIRALPGIGHSSAVPELLELLSDADRQISQAAQESLAALPGQGADTAVLRLLNSDKTSLRLIAIELLGRRRVVSSIPRLLRVARDANAQVRPAAIRKVGELGGPDELPALLNLLGQLKESKDLNAAERALSDVCSKVDNPQSQTGKLTNLLVQVGPAQKSVLLRVLSTIGGTKALKAVREAVDDSESRVHATAIRALGSWKTADAAPYLLELAKTAKNPSDKTLCLRGYLGFASRGDLPGNERLSMCRQAKDLIRRDDEKRLLLGALGSINSPAALALIMPYLDEPAIRSEAGMATVTIAEKLLKGRYTSKLASKLIKPLEKVTQVTANANLARRAKALLRQAQSKASSK